MAAVEMYPNVILHRIAAYDLAGGGPIDVTPRTWRSVLAGIRTERLTGLATAAAEADGLRLSAEQAEELRRAHTDATTLALSLERAVLELVPCFEEEGIGFVVLKGPALAHAFYPGASWRSFSDVDLLVRTSEWRRACALLERAGFHRKLPEPRSGFDERFGKAAVHMDRRGLEVDLHRTLVVGPFGVWLPPEQLLERTEDLVLAGMSVRRLDDTRALIHACLHAVLGWREPLLVPLRDVLQIVRAGSIDWEDLARCAARWRIRSVVGLAFETARDVLGVQLPPEADALTRVSVPRRERRALAAYVTSRRSRGGTIRSTLSAIPGVRGKTTLLRDLLFPDREFLHARAGDGGSSSYLRRWATPIQWFLRRPS